MVFLNFDRNDLLGLLRPVSGLKGVQMTMGNMDLVPRSTLTSHDGAVCFMHSPGKLHSKAKKINLLERGDLGMGKKTKHTHTHTHNDTALASGHSCLRSTTDYNESLLRPDTSDDEDCHAPCWAENAGTKRALSCTLPP